MSEHGNFSSSSSPSKSSSSSSVETLPSTSRNASVLTRIQRNVAEKQRRDKLNGYISELANIVPMVSMSSKRLDKTSILRLSAAHLRLSKSPLGGDKKLKKSFKWCPSFLTSQQVRDILESVDGFLIVTSSSGKILFTSSSVERYLGHQNIDMIGHSLFVFIHPDDLDSVKKEMERLLAASLKCGDSGPAPRCSFRCRIKEKGQPRSEVATYQFVHFVGDMTISDEEGVSSKSVKSTAVVTHIFKSFVRIVDADPYSQLSLEDATADEYVTRHSLDGTIIFADHRLSTITGHLPQEVIGLSAYKYILSEDISIALFAHHLMFSSDKGTGMIVYRLRTQDDKFVYLKSVGCLQFDRATSQVDHFVCVNQHLSDVEGEEQLKYFVDRFIPHIRDSSAVTLFESVKALQVMGVKPPKRIGGINEDIISRFPTKDVKIRISETTNSNGSNDKISKDTVCSSVLFESVKTTNGSSMRTSKSISTSELSSLRKVSADKSVITDISLTTLMKPVQCKKKSKQPGEAELGSKKRKSANNVSVSSEHSHIKPLSVKTNSSLVLDKVEPTTPSNHVKNNDVNIIKVLTSSGFLSPSLKNISIKQEVSESNELQSDTFNPGHEKTKLVFNECNPITKYQDVIKNTNGQVSNSLNIVKNNSLQTSEILKDNSYLLLSQAGNNIPNGFDACASKSYTESFTDSNRPKTVNTLKSKKLSDIKSNVLFDTKPHDDDSKILTSVGNSSELIKLDVDSVSVNGVNVNLCDSNQLSANEHGTIVTETNLWPVESSSESSASNAVSEETVGSSMECSGDDHNLYLMPEGEIKEYLGCAEDISTIFNSTLPLEDSSLPSIDGWSEFLRPEDMFCSATESLVDADQPLIDAFVEKSLNSW